MSFEIVRLDHVQLAMPPGREDEAEAFYAGLLGLERVPKPEPLAVRGGCWFARGELAVHLGVEEDFRPARKAHPAFVVRDLPALEAALLTRGWRCGRIPTGSRARGPTWTTRSGTVSSSSRSTEH